MSGSDFQRAAGELVGGDVEGLAVADDGAAIDEDVFDAGGELAGIRQSGAIDDSLRIEDDDVGEVFFADEAPVGDLESGCGAAREFGDDFLKGVEPLVTNERSEKAIGGAEHAGVDVAIFLFDGIRADEAAIVLQHGPTPRIIAFVEDEEDGEAFFDEEIHQGVFRRETGFGDVLAEELALVTRVFLARDPGDMKFVEGEAIVVESAAKAAADTRVVEFSECCEGAIVPDFVGEEEIEHRRAGEIGIAVE